MERVEREGGGTVNCVTFLCSNTFYNHLQHESMHNIEGGLHIYIYTHTHLPSQHIHTLFKPRSENKMSRLTQNTIWWHSARYTGRGKRYGGGEFDPRICQWTKNTHNGPPDKAQNLSNFHTSIGSHTRSSCRTAHKVLFSHLSSVQMACYCCTEHWSTADTYLTLQYNSFIFPYTIKGDNTKYRFIMGYLLLLHHIIILYNILLHCFLVTNLYV